jgi:hypothetical protein
MATTVQPATPAARSLRWEIRRRHDGSLVSAHCSPTCGRRAINDLTLAQALGDNPPGPLEWAWTDLIDPATGRPGMWTSHLVPLDHTALPEVLSWP